MCFERSFYTCSTDALYNPQDLLSLPSVKLSLAHKAIGRHKRSQNPLHQSRLEHEASKPGVYMQIYLALPYYNNFLLVLIVLCITIIVWRYCICKLWFNVHSRAKYPMWHSCIDCLLSMHILISWNQFMGK